MVMEDQKMSTFIFLLTLFLLSFASHPAPVIGQRHHVSPDNTTPLQTYIVHVQHPEKVEFASPEEREDWYKSFFSKITTTDGAEGPLWVYSYHNVLSGFAARLTEEEMKAMEAKEGFVHAYPDMQLPLLTTHTPDFLGLQLGKGLWGSTICNSSGLGKGVVIGMVDSGVFPDHPSFHDEGMPPPPSSWKGSCEFKTFCNNKIIGARSFNRGGFAINGANGRGGVDVASVDIDGHGTHTASTAAGAFVKNASVLGNANGTAVGMAPLAHLAIYKVCTRFSCILSDILAGIDAAVEDGVDVISLSIGGGYVPFYSHGISIGAFGAVEKGIFVSAAAGNDGPLDATLSNEAPWILTVAASTIDRSITATVTLGDGQKFDGESAFQPGDFPSSMLPLVYNPGASNCQNGSLDGVNVKGKVVLCNRGAASNDTVGRITKGSVVEAAGGAAMILINEEADAYSTIADVHVITTSHVSFSDGSKIKNYIKSSSKPTVSITFKGTILGTSPAPAVTSFSSRGPSRASPGILKPDITGPGVSILAAWPPYSGLLPLPNTTTTKTQFIVLSGTSMSTPHLSGIAALLKSAHPDWSPAAIKSAIITTSDVVANDRKPIKDEKLLPASFFAMGAGHVNPSKAADPGLVYDLGADDYIPYLCGLGYTDAQVGAIVRRKITCSNTTSISERELNYPSLTVTLSPSTTVTVKRTVTNVGEDRAAYIVEVDQLAGVSVRVTPKMLWFSKVKEKKSFTVSFSGNGCRGKVYQGNLRWISSKHTVRSPISVAFV